VLRGSAAVVAISGDRLGLGNIAFTRRLRTLSGGQIVSLGLAAQLLRRPDVLLLDEKKLAARVTIRKRLSLHRSAPPASWAHSPVSA
jgi:ABC-type Mn2+/Zn2+ transport system ATPase subunit